MTIGDINNKIYFLTKTNSTSFSAANLLIAVNNAYEYVAECILKADNKWQWDDNNQTDLPVATTPLVSSQQDYSLATTHLTIDRVEIKDTSGAWHLLTQLDQQIMKRDRGTALAAYQNVSGTPTEYDVIGSSVFLYPIPNYSQAASLKLYFTRGPALFTSAEVSTGTKVPGFNSLFHELIPYKVSFEYALANSQPTAKDYYTYLQQGEQKIIDFYALRNRDERPRMTLSTDSNK